MGTFNILLGVVENLARTGETMPVISTLGLSDETLTSGALSVSGSLTGTDAKSRNSIWELTTSVDVWVNFGASPTAVVGAGVFMTAGTTRNFSAKYLDRVAVINA